MYPFEYAAPSTLDEALGMLREHGDDAKVLAGGQSLIPILQYRLARPRIVVDINALPLADVAADNGRLRLGALVRHHQLEESGVVAQRCPVLAEAARLIGNVRVRALGTVGGSLAHADPAAELAVVMTALDAQLVIASASARRTVAAREFFTGPLTTAPTLACNALDPPSDAFVSGAYRRHLAGVLCRRALARAVERARR